MSTENMTQYSVCSEYLSQENVETAEYNKVRRIGIYGIFLAEVACSCVVLLVKMCVVLCSRMCQITKEDKTWDVA
jgi:hypothetical protein